MAPGDRGLVNRCVVVHACVVYLILDCQGGAPDTRRLGTVRVRELVLLLATFRSSKVAPNRTHFVNINFSIT